MASHLLGRDVDICNCDVSREKTFPRNSFDRRLTCGELDTDASNDVLVSLLLLEMTYTAAWMQPLIIQPQQHSRNLTTKHASTAHICVFHTNTKIKQSQCSKVIISGYDIKICCQK